MIPKAVERLIEYAVKAPSGDNAQPWRFIYRPDNSTLSIEIDESRVDSPQVMWQFVARLSCGAALETCSARRRAWAWKRGSWRLGTARSAGSVCARRKLREARRTSWKIWLVA